jgi:hypothetical protein
MYEIIYLQQQEIKDNQRYDYPRSNRNKNLILLTKMSEDINGKHIKSKKKP